MLGLITAPIGRLHYHSVASIRSFSASATVRLLLLTMLHCHQARVPMLPSQLLISYATAFPPSRTVPAKLSLPYPDVEASSVYRLPAPAAKWDTCPVPALAGV